MFHGVMQKITLAQFFFETRCIYIVNLFTGCLSCVKWDNIYSSMFAVTFGVRQGSVLSPILFNIYVNDLANVDIGLRRLCLILQGGPKKTAPNFSCNNFGKYGPILIMFSLLHSQMN